MAPGNLLIYISLLLALAGIGTSIARIRTERTIFEVYSRLLTIGLFMVISLTLVYLYYLFISSDVSVGYVWQYTRSDHPLKYKISGVLAGMAGSLLFWIWSIALPWFIIELRALKVERNTLLMDWTRMSLLSVMAVLLYVLSLHGIFDPTDAVLLGQSPNGKGLNPLLQTDLMAIHPPIVFLAYGFLAVPFAGAIANLVTGERGWVKDSILWSRLGWLFLTLGIGLGGLWAYTVLGWGGYWAWDPVETSSMLPWIMLTGFMHAQLMYKRKGDYAILAPIMGSLTFLLVIFATFATRAGGLWVSVHTFGQADTQIGAMDRLIEILKTSDMVLIYFIFMILGLLVTTVLAIRRYRGSREEGEETSYTISELINDELLMLATLVLAMISTLVTFIILLNGVNGLTTEDFEGRVGFLTLASILVLTFCLIWRNLGRKWISILGFGAIVISIAGYLLLPDYPLLAASVPILGVALIASGVKIAKTFRLSSPLRSLGPTSAHIIHLAVVLILLGYTASTFMVVEEEVTLTVNGVGEEVAGYTIKAVGLESSPDSIYVEIEVWQGSEFVGKERPGLKIVDGQVRSEIRVAETLTNDIYLVYESGSIVNGQEIVNISVKVLPLMKALWGGLWLMALGILLRMGVGAIPGDRRPKTRSKTPEQEGEKGDDYYDSLIERELAEMDHQKKD